MARGGLRCAGLLSVPVLAGAVAYAIAGPALGSSTSRAVCPRLAPTAIRSSRPGAAANLAPKGAETLLLCRYDGPLGSPGTRLKNRFRLVASRWLSDRLKVAALTAALDRLPRAKGSDACPSETGAAIIGFFGYRSGPTSPVRVDLTGCVIATNGHVFRLAGLNRTTLVDALEALVHAGPSHTAPNGASALITGEVRVCGGPAPGGCFVSTVGGCTAGQGCADSDRVIAIDDAGEVAAEQSLSPRHARFQLRVSPGNYVVELLADGRRVHDRLMQAVGATARARHRTRIVFRFDVP